MDRATNAIEFMAPAQGTLYSYKRRKIFFSIVIPRNLYSSCNANERNSFEEFVWFAGQLYDPFESKTAEISNVFPWISSNKLGKEFI